MNKYQLTSSRAEEFRVLHKISPWNPDEDFGEDSEDKHKESDCFGNEE